MRSLIKRSLLALACITASEIIHPAGAIAGDRPVASPDSGSSGLSDTFLPADRISDSPVAIARIRRELADALQMLQTRQSVESVGGRSLALSSDDLAAIVAAVSTEVDLDALERQLIVEMDGLELEISALDASPRNLAAAVEATNDLILNLDSEQLLAAVESPTFMALLRLLEAANQATDEEGNLTVISSDSSKRLLQISRP